MKLSKALVLWRLLYFPWIALPDHAPPSHATLCQAQQSNYALTALARKVSNTSVCSLLLNFQQASVT